MKLALVFLAAFLAACNSPVTVSNAEAQKFQIAADAKGGGVWKLNTATGELWICAPSDGQVVCAKSPGEQADRRIK